MMMMIMSTTCFGQYYLWPSSGWVQLSEKTTQYIKRYDIMLYIVEFSPIIVSNLMMAKISIGRNM